MGRFARIREGEDPGYLYAVQAAGIFGPNPYTPRENTSIIVHPKEPIAREDGVIHMVTSFLSTLYGLGSMIRRHNAGNINVQRKPLRI